MSKTSVQLGNIGNIHLKGDCSKKCPENPNCEPDGLRPPNPELLQRVNDFDNNRKIRYIPDRPPFLVAPPNGPFPPQYEPGQQYPWLSPTIPAAPLQTLPSPASGLPNQDGYSKSIAINYYLPYYAGFDPFNWSESDPRATLFQVNLRNRGPDNYRKKVYMEATRNCIMDRFAQRIDTFVNRAFARMTTYDAPVVSSFAEEVLRFFFEIHLGTAEYPEYVVDYFRQFVKLISYQDQSYFDANEGEGAWNALLTFGWRNSDRVFAFLDQRSRDLIAEGDESTLGFWWFKAGLAIEAVSTECLHNIFAFANFTAMLRNMILDKIGPQGGGGIQYPPPPAGPGPQQFNFFQKFKDATTGAERMNVSREFMRLTSPSASTTSQLEPAGASPPPEAVTAQSRHLNQLVMITTEQFLAEQQNPGNPLNALAYFQYDTSRYAGWDASFDNSGGQCPFQPANAGDLNDPAKKFETSPIDGETVIDKSEPNAFPLFTRPWYMPFGLGYRRCAGENFVHLVNFKLFQRFGELEYELRQPAINYPEIGIAFVTRVRDNLFVVQPQ